MEDQERSPQPLRLVVVFDDSPAGRGGLRCASVLARTWGAQAKGAFDIRSTTEVLSGDPGTVVPRRAAELEAKILIIGTRRRAR